MSQPSTSTKCNDESGEEDMNQINSISKNPMQTDWLVERVLRLLSFDDLKNSRIVCSRWNDIGTSILTKQSKISFDFKSGNTSAHLERMDGRFTSFRFAANPNDLQYSDLNNFFDKQRNTIEEFEMNLTDLFLGDGKLLPYYDVSPWIKYSTITKLSLAGGLQFQFALSLYQLPCIKELFLHKVNAHVKKGIRVCPIKVDFNGVKFFRDGMHLSKFCVNDAIDFRKATHVSMISGSDSDSTLTLRFSEFVNVYSLNLSGFEPKSSKRNINSLRMDRVTKMVKEISRRQGQFDLSDLPNSIERLQLKPSDASIVSTQFPIHFPFLKYLNVWVDGNKPNKQVCPFQFFVFFQRCPNLISVDIDSGLENMCDIDWIPGSVKNIKMTRPGLTNKLNKKLAFDKIVLDGFYFLFAITLLRSGIRTKILVLDCLKDIYSIISESLIKFLTEHDLLLFIGRFNWHRDFGTSELYKEGYINTQAEYYVFENKKGTPISEEQFMSMKLLEGEVEL